MLNKSQIVQFFLCLFFGPLGLFYSSLSGALVWLVVVIVVGGFTFGVGALFIWPFIILTGMFTVHRHNRGVKAEKKRHEELVQAAREGKI